MASDVGARSRAAVVAVTGSSGFIGSALVAALERDGHEVRRIVRRPARSAREVTWDPQREMIDADALVGSDVVVHLAGESIGRRWTFERKRRIRDSRVAGTTLLARTIANLPPQARPRAFLSASAVGYYGNRGDEILDETSGPGTGFLATVCVDWERATDVAAAAGIRVVTMRNGLVMSPSGGMLAMILPLFRLGLGGQIGSGRQWMSWIALTDLIRAIRFLFDADQISGPVNMVAPTPTTNLEFTRTIGRFVGRPTIMRVPGFAARVALGAEMADETVLSSQRVMPRRLLSAGFQFEKGEGYGLRP